MPPKLTYPGVYIEELPSGVHTIAGVATSIAAFVGWAPQGPVDKAMLVESWSDFQTKFGGLDFRSYLGYSVNQFFGNGGQQLYIVRLVWDGSLPPAPGTTPVPCVTARAVGVGLATSVITATAGSVSGASTLTAGMPILQSIAITPANPPWLQLGQTLQINATATYSDGTKKDVTGTATWSSSAKTVATISSSGLSTAVAPGTSILAATIGAVTASVAVTVSAATLASISVTPGNPSIAVGQNQQFTATGTYSDGKSQDLTAIVTWSSATLATATIIAAGLAKGVAAGSSIITSTLGAVSGITTLTVVAAVIQSISVTPSSPPWLQPTKTQQFKATATYSDGTSKDVTSTATWSSANVMVATVNASGLAAAVAAGSSLITATSGAVSGSATLTVTTATLSAIAVTPAAPAIPVGLTLQLTATGSYSDGTSQDLTGSVSWTSATISVATVNISGLTTGASTGTSVITAALGPVSGKITLTVTAPVLSKIAVTPLTSSIPSGQAQQFTATGTFSDGSTQNLTGSVTWSSSVPPVATVSAGGLATAVAPGGTLTLFAANPGQWGNNLQVGVAVQSANPNRFGLQVLNGGRVVENFVNLSVTPTDPQYVVTLIDNDSQYISFIDPATNTPVVPTAAPAATPTGSPISLSGGADGSVLVPASDGNFELALTSNPSAGVYLLDRIHIFNMLCVPAETDAPTIQNLQAYCFKKRAFYIVDSPQTATTSNLIASGPVGSTPGSLTGQYSINAAYYYPWVQAPDPLFGNRPALFPPSGFAAGIYAATDASRGVWKAPAGIDASLSGTSGLQYVVTDLENGDLNVQAINCLRQFKVYGDVVWGARTLQGNDQAGSQWKYVPIRRMALFLESSLYDGTQWVVFEPNDEALWGQIRLNVGAFMQGLFLQGAFQGTTPQQAYFVKCDAENNPQSSINLGIVYILVGFAPLYPAEFVVIQIEQIAGQLKA